MGRCKIRGESVVTSSNSCGSVRTVIPQGFSLHSLASEAGRTFSLSQLGQPCPPPPFIRYALQQAVCSHRPPEHLLFSAPWKKEAQDPSKNSKWGYTFSLWFSYFVVLDFMCRPLRAIAPSSSPSQCLCLTQVASWKGLGLHFCIFLTAFSSVSPAFQLAGFAGSCLCFRSEGCCHHRVGYCHDMSTQTWAHLEGWQFKKRIFHKST